MNEYIGTVGSKISAEVTLTGIHEYTDYKFSYYGTTHYIYTMKDTDNNVLVWKTTSTLGFNFTDDKGCEQYDVIRKGDSLTISGTIKEHGEYKGTNQTVLTRCKFQFISHAPTKQDMDNNKAAEQLASLVEGDLVWEMPYKQYKEHYSDCEIVAGSYCTNENTDKISTIKVIIRKGRLKNSGVRGQHFKGWEFTSDEGKKVCYRAVSEENARKQMLKDFSNSNNWECTRVYDHKDRNRYFA